MKALKRFIFFLLFLCGLLIGTVLVVINFFGDQIKESAISQLNQVLLTEVKVEQINLSGFVDFPSISVDLNNIYVEEKLIKIGKADTLLHCEHLYLQFNVWDILQDNYKINDVILKNGFLNLIIDKDGYTNFEIFKTGESDSSNFLVDLTKINLVQTKVSYKNAHKKESVLFTSNDFYAKGKFDNEGLSMDLFGDIRLNNYHLQNLKYDLPTYCKLDIGAKLTYETGALALGRAKISLDQIMDLSTTGTVTFGTKNTSLDLEVNSAFQTKEASKYLPKSVEDALNKYQIDAHADLNMKVNGVVGGKTMPAIALNFKLNDGKIIYNDKLRFNGMEVTGEYESKKERLSLSEVNGQFNDYPFQAKFTCEDFNKPDINLQLKASSSLENIKTIFEVDTLESVSGDVQIDAKISGKLSSVEHWKKADLLKMATSGKLTVSQASFAIKGQQNAFNNINASFLLNGNDFKVKDMTGSLESSSFKLNGIFRNALSFVLLPNEQLTIDAEIDFDKLDLNKLLASNTSDEGEEYKLALPAIKTKLQASVGDLTFRKFQGKNIVAKILLNENSFVAKNISVDCFDGKSTGEVSVSNYGSKLRVTANLTSKNTDISKMFESFENFGQSEITHQHLSGQSNYDAYFTGLMDHELNLDSKSVKATVSLTINKGELRHYKPLLAIPDYFRTNKLLKLFVKADDLEQKLNVVAFDSFSNTFSIKNETIYIPKMTLNTSALRLDVSGTHTFNNDLDYKLSFYLSELLTNANQKDDYHINEDGWSKVFLTIKGPIDNFEIKHNKKAFKQQVKESYQEEKKEIKAALKEDFGLFKNDTSVHIEEVKPKENFDIIWEEDEPKKEVKQDTTKKKKTTLEKIFKGKDDDSGDDNSDLFGDDDDDDY